MLSEANQTNEAFGQLYKEAFPQEGDSIVHRSMRMADRKKRGAVAQLARALHWQCRGPGFKSL